MNIIQLFHTGFQIIPEPDIRIGRKNADFGQGFYLSDNEAFSRRWARSHRDQSVYLNRYELENEGLKVRHLIKNEEWFDYIFKNRSGYPDDLKEYDIIIGPIANDTIYDTFGITTSGLLTREQALALLLIGPSYEQTVIKTDRAVKALRFVDALEISKNEIESYRAIVREEEVKFQKLFAELLEKMQ